MIATGSGREPRHGAGLRAIVLGARPALTEIRRGHGKIVTPRRQRIGNTMIIKVWPGGIGLASGTDEGTGLRPWAFDPPPLVATFGRTKAAPIFFALLPLQD